MDLRKKTINHLFKIRSAAIPGKLKEHTCCYGPVSCFTHDIALNFQIRYSRIQNIQMNLKPEKCSSSNSSLTRKPPIRSVIVLADLEFWWIDSG